MLLAILAVLGGGYIAYRRQARPALPPGDPAAALLERTVKDIRANDVIQHDNHDYLVEGVIKYDEDGHTWSAARLVDGSIEHWLLVGLERGATLTVRLLSKQTDLELNAYPGETLELAGTTYKLASRGAATAALTGDLDALALGAADGSALRCRWWKYAAAGEKILLVEQWGESYRALAGDTIRADSVELLAAS